MCHSPSHNDITNPRGCPWDSPCSLLRCSPWHCQHPVPAMSPGLGSWLGDMQMRSSVHVASSSPKPALHPLPFPLEQQGQIPELRLPSGSCPARAAADETPGLDLNFPISHKCFAELPTRCCAFNKGVFLVMFCIHSNACIGAGSASRYSGFLEAIPQFLLVEGAEDGLSF